MPTAKKKLTTYVALLRGINVGGNAIVSMAKLKVTFEHAGFVNVKTFINSGNVIFRATETNQAKLCAKIEASIKKDFKLDIRVTTRSLADYAKMLKTFPKDWGTDPKCRHYVLFLFPEVDSKNTLKELAPREGIDQAWYAKGAILWSTDLKALTRSSLQKMMSVPKMYRAMTIRNANSTRKIFALMQAAETAE